MQTEGNIVSQLRKSFHAKCLCNLIFFHISKRWAMSGKSVAKWDIFACFEFALCALHI